MATRLPPPTAPRIGLDADGDSLAVTVVAAIVVQAALAFRRRDPLLAAVVFSIPTALQAAIGGFLTQDGSVQFLSAMLLLYSIGRYSEGRPFWIAAPLVMGGSATATTIEGGLERAEYLVWFLLIFTLPALVGRGLRSRARLQHELREKAELAELEREDRAQRAEQAFAAIEETGRDALAEMRRLLGVLRRDDERAELAPQPGLGRLGALVERAREGGLDVSVREEGDARPLAPGLDLTAYRIVQDALDAAAEKGASRAQVLVRFGERELTVGVRDDREGGAWGRLAGLRDRAQLYGGYLDAARSGEWFALRARLPIEHEAAAPALPGAGS